MAMELLSGYSSGYSKPIQKISWNFHFSVVSVLKNNWKNSICQNKGEAIQGLKRMRLTLPLMSHNCACVVFYYHVLYVSRNSGVGIFVHKSLKFEILVFEFTICYQVFNCKYGIMTFIVVCKYKSRFQCAHNF